MGCCSSCFGADKEADYAVLKVQEDDLEVRYLCQKDGKYHSPDTEDDASIILAGIIGHLDMVQMGIPDERTRLLGSTVRNIQTQPVNGESLSSPVPTGAPPKDEQSALTRILTKTARNVIDVATIEGQGVEQHEYYERARHYSQKVSVILANRNKSLKPLLPNGVSAPQIILAAQPISLADIELISNAAVKAAKAMKDVKVQHKEDLVVAFGVP